MIEYDCYDGRWRGQGKAVVELVSYEDESAGTLKAIHLAASDGYYSYYAEEKLAVDNVVYHLCTGEAKKCGFKLPRGDRREVVHLARWRMVNPSILMLEGWSKDVAMACMRDGVRKFVPHPMEPPRVPGAAPAAAGSGLDAALAAIPVVDDKEDRPQRREKNPESSRRSQKICEPDTARESPGSWRGGRAGASKKRRKKRARSSGGLKKAKEKKEKEDEVFSSESSFDESESSGGSVFQNPPIGGGETFGSWPNGIRGDSFAVGWRRCLDTWQIG